MSVILNLETATTNCSVSVARDGKLLAIKEHDTPKYSHSEQLHVFIREVLQNAHLETVDVDAIAVSKGPGSYTGLRIGVSAAKGLCFSLDVPLISISTLKSMACQSITGPSGRKVTTAQEIDGTKMEQLSKVPKTVFEKSKFIIPLLDARRMEVYSAVFDSKMNQVRKTRAEIIDEHSFSEYIEKGRVLLLGSGAEKCKEVLKHPNFDFDTSMVPSAKQMVKLSHKKFEANDFENVAYFEPYYLKDFILQKKKSG